MTVVRGMELGRELVTTLSQIQQQIEEVKKEAKDQQISPYKFRTTDNGYILAPLLAAKAQALHALVLVNQRG
jgi:hypothetical protein